MIFHKYIIIIIIIIIIILHQNIVKTTNLIHNIQAIAIVNIYHKKNI